MHGWSLAPRGLTWAARRCLLWLVPPLSTPAQAQEAISHPQSHSVASAAPKLKFHLLQRATLTSTLHTFPYLRRKPNLSKADGSGHRSLIITITVTTFASEFETSQTHAQRSHQDEECYNPHSPSVSTHILLCRRYATLVPLTAALNIFFSPCLCCIATH
jgi:hypothetical protein